MLFDQEVHQLALTEPGAEWQLWGRPTTSSKAAMINRTLPYNPRLIVDFPEWNLKNEPANAKEVAFSRKPIRNEWWPAFNP